MAEARANSPAFGGYDDQFLGAVDDDCHCVICQLPLKQPIQTKCGHRFCTHCLYEHFERLERDRQPLNCPVDRDKLSRDKGDIFPDKATERKILSFSIKCPNDGCQWSGELRSKENHLASCPLQVLSCTNENCNVGLPRKDLQSHVTFTCDWRVLHCGYCDVSHAACKTKAHQSECKKLPLKCPNKCEAIIPREEVQRRKIESHLQSATNLHLDLACTKLNDTRIKLTNTQHQLNDTQLQLSNTQQEFKDTKTKLEEKISALESPSLIQISGIHTWKICGFEEKMKQAKRGEKTLINSPPFYDHGYKFGLTLDPNRKAVFKSYVAVEISLLKGEYDAVLSWPLPNKKITVVLIDQQEDPRQRENKVISLTSHNKRYNVFSRVGNDKGHSSVHSLLMEHDSLKKRRYVVDDTIFIQFHIDLA